MFYKYFKGFYSKKSLLEKILSFAESKQELDYYSNFADKYWEKLLHARNKNIVLDEIQQKILDHSSNKFLAMYIKESFANLISSLRILPL